MFPVQAVLILYDVRMTFWILYGPYIHYIKNLFLCKKSSVIDVISQIDESSNVSDDWRFWLDSPTLKSVFFNFTVKCYVSENILFYEDVMKYIQIGEDLQRSMHKNSGNKVNDSEIQLWCKMYKEASQIYKLYIKIPTAPLEINISNSIRDDFYHIFRFIRHKNGTIIITDEIPIFPDISGMKLFDALIVVKSFTLAFDSTLSTIMKLIDRDVFPRFKGSKAYKTAINEFIDNLNV